MHIHTGESLLQGAESATTAPSSTPAASASFQPPKDDSSDDDDSDEEDGEREMYKAPSEAELGVIATAAASAGSSNSTKEGTSADNNIEEDASTNGEEGDGDDDKESADGEDVDIAEEVLAGLNDGAVEEAGPAKPLKTANESENPIPEFPSFTMCDENEELDHIGTVMNIMPASIVVKGQSVGGQGGISARFFPRFLLSFLPSFHLSLRLPSFRLSIFPCLSVVLSFRLSVVLSFCLSVFPSFCLSVPFCSSVVLSFCRSGVPPFRPSSRPNF